MPGTKKKPPKQPAPRPLTPQQEEFARQYVVDFNPGDAYLRSGYQVASKEVAGRNASRLLRDARIRHAVDQYLYQKAEQNKLTPEEVIHKYRREANNPNNPVGARLKAIERLGQICGLLPFDLHRKVPVEQLPSQGTTVNVLSLAGMPPEVRDQLLTHVAQRSLPQPGAGMDGRDDATESLIAQPAPTQNDTTESYNLPLFDTLDTLPNG